MVPPTGNQYYNAPDYGRHPFKADICVSHQSLKSANFPENVAADVILDTTVQLKVQASVWRWIAESTSAETLSCKEGHL